MKLLAIAAVAIALFHFAPESQASDCYRFRRSACTPTYRYTRQIDSHCEVRWATDHCGRRFRYRVKVVTYADVYSDASYRTYTRTFGI